MAITDKSVRVLYTSSGKNQMNIYQKFAVVAAGIALSFTTKIKQVQAATVTYNFTVNVTSGNLAGQTGSGSFSYDDSSLTGRGLETLSVDSLSFNFLNNLYTDNDDYFYPQGYPTLDLNNGSVVGLNSEGATKRAKMQTE